MSQQITVYTLEELKKKFPGAYKKVREKWERSVDEDPDVSWQDEIMASLKAVVKAAGYSLSDWSIGPYGGSWMRVDLPESDYEDEEDQRSDLDQFYAKVLKPAGYKKAADGQVEFPGLCPWTGVCFDEDLAECVWNTLCTGARMKDALEYMASKAEELLEQEVEHERTEERMNDAWEDRLFTDAGQMIRQAPKPRQGVLFA